MKNHIFLMFTLAVLSACTSAQNPASNAEPSKASGTTSNADGVVSLFDEAHRCEGVVKYQAEIQNGEMRSRLTCEWTVRPDSWGAW